MQRQANKPLLQAAQWRWCVALGITFIVNNTALATSPLPHISAAGGCSQLIVDGNPFLMIGGELHNSSASTPDQITTYLRRVRGMNLNTVLAPISWELFEPSEGGYDYTLIDRLVSEARANDLKLVVLWFATWKNGQSSYAPLWVKRDTERFHRVVTAQGELLETLSPFCAATEMADARAFAALMSRIREVDPDGTVVMVQPENEAGIFLPMDHSEAAQAALADAVPTALLHHMAGRGAQLTAEIQTAWDQQGRPEAGNWTEVFGDGPEAREFLLAWRTARFINSVADAGRQQHPLPMFVNAWIVQHPDEPAGSYPNGGPVARVMDIYKAAAPSLFTLAPDIYLPNFKAVCSRYARDDNPLLIPESTVDAGRAFYAFAEHDAMCYSPFGIEERGWKDGAFQQACSVLTELHDSVAAYQGTGRMRGVLRESDERVDRFVLGSYAIDVYFESQSEPCYGIVIQPSDDEFLVAGVNLRIEFRSADPSVTGYLGHVREVRRDGDQWQTVRVLNGDETFHHGSLRVLGRESRIGYGLPDGANLGPQPTADNPEADNEALGRVVRTPGIYLVTTYTRDR